MERAAVAASIELRRGLRSLSVIAKSAPLLGMLGTCVLMGEVFARGIVGEKSAITRAIIIGLRNCILPTGLGLLVATVAFWVQRYLSARAEMFEVEMRVAGLELASWLERID